LRITTLSFLFLASETANAIEPMDEFPPTTFSVTLVVRPPQGNTFTKTIRYLDTSQNLQQTTFSYNYTPAYPSDVLPDPPQLPVTWNVAAAVGVSVSGRGWDSIACILGDISQTPPNSLTSNCSSAFQGNAGPALGFSAAGAPLSRTFQVSTGSDLVRLGASLDNLGAMSVQNEANSLGSSLGNGLQAFGGLIQIVGTVVAVPSSGYGAVIIVLGTFISALGSIISISPDLNQATSVDARRNCLGGLLGNPPSGSMIPQDAVTVSFTASQLYEGTRNGPLFLTVPTQMNYTSSDPPWGFNACQAATNVIFVVDRPRNPVTNTWSDGLAFQPRSPDSAVVRRRNAVESFRVDPVRQRIEHDSWRYTPFETTVFPSDGLAVCNGPQSCSPHGWADAVDGYIASAVDPSGQHPPTLTNAATPLTALSPDLDQLALFFVDDTGGLYISIASYGQNDTPVWKTWLLATALPPNARVSALRASPDTRQYTLFWVGTDRAVRSAAIDATSQSAVSINAISTPIAVPGAALAAVERSPGQSEVFVVGQSGITILSNTNAGGLWSPAQIGPSIGRVAIDSPIAVVATTTNNLDVFFVDASQTVQHVAFTNQLASWSFDSSLPQVVMSTSNRQLSAVSRGPNNIDMVVPCDSSGLCNLSITNANSFPNMLQGQAPVVSPAGFKTTGPLSIVAASSSALDVIAESGQNAFDMSWQLGAQSWATTLPVATCDASTCWSFTMSVAPTSVAVPTNNSVSVLLSTTMLNDARPISLTFNTPSGVFAGMYDPTTVTPGQEVYLGFWPRVGTLPGHKGPITIIGTNTIETHSVTVDWTTTACVPTTCQAEGIQCGSISDNCGGTLLCGSCGKGLVCWQGLCLLSKCAKPKPCPKGQVWDSVACGCTIF
jgi:hypothetical protein